MIRHMLLFSFRGEVGESERQQLLSGLRQFPSKFPRMRGFELGRNESQRDSTFDYGMTLMFDTSDDVQQYLPSDEHERFVSERFRPVVSERAIVSFAF